MAKKISYFAQVGTGALLALAVSLPASSMDAPTPVKIKHYLPGSLMVAITDRGQKVLNNQIENIVSNLGFSFNEAYFTNLQWQSDVSYKLDDVNIDPDAKKLILTVRDTLKSWFAGFPLGDVKPAIQIGNSGYQAVFNKFSITSDEKLLHQLKKTNGAILVVDLDIKEIDLTASKVRVWDANSPSLGQAGYDSAQIKVAGGTTSLQMRMPFYVNINDQGVPVFEAVGLQQNFDKINLEFTHSPLITPQIQLVVNGVSYPFDSTALGKTIDQNMPTFLSELRNYLHSFTSQQLPNLLNQKAKQFFVKDLEQVQELAPPGADPGSTAQFHWGLQLKSIDENNGVLIDLNTFVEDPGNADSKPNPAASSKQAPQMNAVNKSNYDVAIAINEGMINRMLQLSYEKQLFSHMVIDDGVVDPKCQVAAPNPMAGAGKYMKLMAVPTMKPLGNYKLPPSSPTDAAYVRVPISVQVPKGTISGYQKWAIKDAFVINFDTIIKVEKTSDGKSIQIILWDLDESSINIDSKYLNTFGLFKGFVLSEAKSEFVSLAQMWRCKNVALPGTVPVPAIFGVSFMIDQMQMESTGNLVMYMDYAGPGASTGATK